MAEKIECENFANIFTSAINLLDGCNEYPDEKFGLSLPPIPQQNLQMFEAASVSDVLEQWVRGMIAQHIWLTKRVI